MSNAIADCTEAIRLDPKDDAPIFHTGSGLQGTKGNYDIALADCTPNPSDFFRQVSQSTWNWYP